KALGRPSRETVITSRVSQASLLQALELTNGAKLTEALHAGAAAWKEKYATTDTLVNALYLKALGRPATAEEINVVKSAIGPVPSEENIQDLVWAILLVPEFQLIYEKNIEMAPTWNRRECLRHGTAATPAALAAGAP